MDFLKSLFDKGALTWEDFSKAVTEKGFKPVDLAAGNYISKDKYTDEIKDKDSQIQTLTGQISTRDTDIKNLQDKMNAAKTDKDKLNELTNQLSELQSNYNKAKEDFDKSRTDYETKIANQQYEFAVKEFADGQKFSSKAARRDFINGMMDKKLSIEEGKIIGATDYLEQYKKDNADSFDTVNKPTFADTTKDKHEEGSTNPFLSAMHFTEVRPRTKEE